MQRRWSNEVCEKVVYKVLYIIQESKGSFYPCPLCNLDSAPSELSVTSIALKRKEDKSISKKVHVHKYDDVCDEDPEQAHIILYRIQDDFQSNHNSRTLHKGPMRSALRDTAPVHRLHRRGIPLLHEVTGTEPQRFQLADDGVDLARRVPLHRGRARVRSAAAGRDEAVGRKPADDEVEVRQGALLQGGGVEVGDGALGSSSSSCCCGAVVGAVGDGDEAVLAEQGDDEGDAGDGAFLDQGVEADEGGVALRGGCCVRVGDVAGLLEIDNVGVDEGAHGAVLRT